ncbi:SDR family NAD(P)-dependent oxidoreductase [Antarcticirhabdus aurantiaca]|uniref:SDR family oxidoreductase n=1 Tax=Antarcticirhabdus aurantiaca TaxID=2606717 RepID=A0ACD4NU83_9HYPH|nr:SDR family oxidoreductase [Jeongeuplla avenae]
MDLRLENRRVLVVGGSDGIGRATAELLLSDGARVAIASRSAENLAAAADELTSATGKRPDTLVLDATEASSGDAAAAFVRDRWGGLDALVMAVGGSVRADFASLDDADWLRNYEFNVLSVVRVIRALAPLLAAGSAPSIVVLGAAAAKMPYAHQIMSNVHKAGLLGLVKTLGLELGEAGIRVNAVAPGRTRTSLWIKRATGIAAERGIDLESVFAEFSAEIPLKRFAEPEEVAVMATWLSSPLASYVTGQTINVDGGIARGLL